MLQTASLFEFSKGGGGFIGIKHNCRLSFNVVEYRFQSKDRTTGAVTKNWPTQCFVAVQLNVLDPVDPEYSETTQYLKIGSLPKWRTEMLGEAPDEYQLQYPGGFLPSVDGVNPTTSGAFVGIEQVNGKPDAIYEYAPWAVFESELQNLANQGGVLEQYKNALTTKGVAGLDGIEVFIDDKVPPKPPKKKGVAAPAAATSSTSDEKKMIIPTKVNRWPWDAPGAATQPVQPTTQPPMPQTVQQPKPAPAAAASATASPASGGNGVDYDALAVEWVKKAGAAFEGGVVPNKGALTQWVFLNTAKVGPARTEIMSRVGGTNSDQWLSTMAAAGHFLVGPDGSIMVIQ